MKKQSDPLSTFIAITISVACFYFIAWMVIEVAIPKHQEFAKKQVEKLRMVR